MTTIEKPGKGTKIREGMRVTAEAGMGLLPAGGFFNLLTRNLLPSKLDKQNADWQDVVTQATNQQGADVKGLQKETVILQLEQASQSERLEYTRDLVEALTRRVDFGILETDPLDGELEICRDMVLNDKFMTALELLSDRFEDPKRSDQISLKLMARVRSLQGMCLKNLGEYAAASKHFLLALDLDPENPKIRANAAVGYMIVSEHTDAESLIDKLLIEEPDSTMHWANKVYVQSAQGVVWDSAAMPEVVRQSEDVCISIVDAMRANDDNSWLEEARMCAGLHPTSTRAKRHLAEANLDRAMSAHIYGLNDPKAQTEAFEDAILASKELANQWEAHVKTESFQAKPDFALIQNRIVGYRLVNNWQDAETLIAANTELLLSDDRTKSLVAIFAMNTGNDVLVDRVLSTDFEGDKNLRVEHALQKEKWAAAIELLELFPDELRPARQIDPEYMGDVLRVLVGPDEGKLHGFMDIFERGPPKDGYYDLFLCQMASMTSNAQLLKLADQVFDRVITSDLTNNAELRRAIASAGMDRDKPAVVIDVLLGHVDPSRDSRERNWLAVSYARESIPRESGVAFFTEVRKSGVKDAGVNRAGGHFNLNRRQPGEAVAWFKRSLAEEPNNVRTQLAYWQALSRNGATKCSKDFLSKVDLHSLVGPNSDLIGMAQLLWQEGRVEALEYAYELTARNRNDAQVALTYSGFLLGDAFKTDVPPIPASKDVSVGSMVRLTRPHHNDWVIVVTEDESDIPLHVKIDNAIVSAALNKRVGDVFETTSGPNKFVWTVAEIKSKYLHLFHDISQTFQDQFPDNGSFYSIKMVDDDITPLLENLRERKKGIEKLEEQYREYPMPLGTMALAGGGSAVNFAIHLALLGQQIFTATGYAADTDGERQIAADALQSVVVIDAYTAWLLGTLNLLEATREVFPKLTVPASSIDEFSEMVGRMGEHPDGCKSMSAQEDGFIIEEFSADEVATQANLLRNMRDLLVKISNVVGIEIPADVKPELLRMADFMGSQFDCMSVVQREDGVLLSADLRLRQFTTSFCEKQAFGIDALLWTLATEKAISVKAYADALLKLCGHGHSYVAFNSQTLMNMLMVDATPNLQRFELAANYLGTPNADVKSHIVTAAEFAKRAFVHYGQGQRAQQATGIVLRKLVRMDGVSLSQTLNAFLQASNSPTITNYVLGWLRGHFLMETYERQCDEAQKTIS